jgi:predicted RNase H-like HicB family nuclease
MSRPVIEFEGIYGGAQSREVVLRMLKEALALVENTEPGVELICSGFRIEEIDEEEES